MKHQKEIFSAIFLLGTIACFILSSCSKEQAAQPQANTTKQDTVFIPSISDVWIDTVSNTRKVTIANVANSNQVFGGDHWLGDSGEVNLFGFVSNFSISYTVMIKHKPASYPKWYIDYQGTITDTSAMHKRMVVYSVIDTLYLKPQ